MHKENKKKIGEKMPKKNYDEDMEEFEEMEKELKGNCKCGDDCECDDSTEDLAVIATKVDAILELLLEKKIFTEAQFEKKYDELCERDE